VRRIAAAVGVLAGAALAVLPASAAWAHDAVPAASDYHTELVAVRPQPRGLDVRVVQNGSRIQVHNRTGEDVTVLGYSGEPYLRITPDAVFANTRSPAAYVNETVERSGAVPEDGAAARAAEPSWRRIADRPVIRWHDHRSHWTRSGRPPAVEADPASPHRIADWSVHLLAATTPVTVTGTLDYAPPPQTPVWWAGILVLAAAVALIGRWRHGVPALGALLVLAAAAELTDGLGRVVDGGASGIGVLGRLLTAETYGTATVVGAIAAAVLALRRRPGAPFAVALAGACLAMLGGVTDAAVFAQAYAPTPWSGEVARLLTAATIGIGAGVTLAGWLRVRSDRVVPAPAAVSPVPG
jgi:hypothetical protein